MQNFGLLFGALTPDSAVFWDISRPILSFLILKNLNNVFFDDCQNDIVRVLKIEHTYLSNFYP